VYSSRVRVVVSPASISREETRVRTSCEQTPINQLHSTLSTATERTLSMADSHDPFPNVKEKLTARTKKSAFEKSRLEAEAKRLREEAETAAVYKDFVASFDQEPSGSTSGASDSAGARGSHGGARGSTGDSRGGLRGGPPSGPGRRHFTSAPPRATQAPISSGPQNRKRNIESIFEREEEVSGFGSAGLSDRDKRRLRESNTGLLAFENSAPPNRSQDQYSPDDGSGTLAFA